MLLSPPRGADEEVDDILCLPQEPIERLDGRCSNIIKAHASNRGLPLMDCAARSQAQSAWTYLRSLPRSTLDATASLRRDSARMGTA